MSVGAAHYDRPVPGPQASHVARGCLAIMLILVAAGCGKTTVVGSARTVDIALSEYRLNPDNVRVKSGYLTIVAHNYGRLTHNLSLSLNGQSEGSTQPIAPGQSADLVVALGPGTYTMSSTILEDQALGAYGTLTVTA